MRTDLTDFEKQCLADAIYFTAIRGHGANRQRWEFDAIDQAVEHGLSFGDARTMIYAVTAQGHSAHIRNA